MKIIAILFIGVLVLGSVGGLWVYRQAEHYWSRFGTLPTKTLTSLPLGEAAISSQNAELPDENLPPVQVGAEMGVAAETGKLPMPLPIPGGDPDKAAADLAEKIARMDGQSTAALVGAVGAAGFKIRGEDGSVIFPRNDPGQGIAFDAWEVRSMAKSYGDGSHIMLDDWSSAFAQTLPEFANISLAKLVVEAIQADAESNKPALRFWARLIAELGRHSSTAYDLLSPSVQTASIRLDSVQFGLILRRLSADLAIRGSKNPVKQQSWNPGCGGPRLENGVSPHPALPHLVDTAWHPDVPARYFEAAYQEGAGENLPCALSEPMEKLLDGVAYVNGFGFDKLMELLGDSGSTMAQGYSRFTLIANAVLAYAKLAWTIFTMDAKIEMVGSPLVRTLNSVPGCHRTLKARIAQKTGNAQIVNCLRLMFNHAGLDFNLPQDGPLKKTKTQWIILSGKTIVSHQDNSIDWAIVQWAGHGPRIQDPGTYAGIQGVAPGVAVTDFTQAMTDDDGRVEITIEGAPRRNAIIGKAVPVMKEARVQLEFAAKPPDLSQDLVDAGGGALALNSNPMMLLTQVSVELILRSRWFASPVYTVPVKDWQECRGGWSGTISYSVHGGQDLSYERFHFDQKVTIHVIGDGDSSAHVEHHSSYWSGDSRNWEQEVDDVSGDIDDGVVPLVVLDDGHYSIPPQGVSFPAGCTARIDSNDRHLVTNGCGYLRGIVLPTIDGALDPKMPGRIHGSKPVVDPPATGSIEWSLTSCNDVDRNCSKE